jgi:uncharacterized protein (TIGR03086 family)
MDLLDLDRRALAATATRLDGLTSDDLTLPTPCAEWDVRALLEHLVGGNHLFAASASGTDVDWSAREGDRLGGDPAAAWAASADAVTRAFADADLDREVEMRFGCVPVRQAILVHFVDVLAHGWDLAVARGLDTTLDDELASAAIDIVAFYPPDLFGTPTYFAAQRTAPAGATPGDRLVAALGRGA